jgi:hypothetical protein
MSTNTWDFFFGFAAFSSTLALGSVSSSLPSLVLMNSALTIRVFFGPASMDSPALFFPFEGA